MARRSEVRSEVCPVFYSSSDAVTQETDFSNLLSLLCKLRRHADTAAIRQRMTTVVFLTAYCTRLLLQPKALWVRGDIEGGRE